MVERKRLQDDVCPSARALDVIGDWWSLLIVRDAFDGLSRFGEFQQSLGIAKNILAARLRSLVQRGILQTSPAEAGRMSYQLTPKGRDLFPVMVALRQWGEQHLFESGERRSRLVERDTGEVVRLEVRAANGRPIGPDDAMIVKPDPLER
ncbi:helix-turn-helix domain-containing protein [Phenylobacterium sp. LjRoot219]|uniref:winged helix-turn-helix transcriptional regulator n=1 Tax=Phenylobacterium sp. LjRoot219 TaxID=3342283 RepID=UPI003ECED3C6